MGDKPVLNRDSLVTLAKRYNVVPADPVKGARKIWENINNKNKWRLGKLNNKTVNRQLHLGGNEYEDYSHKRYQKKGEYRGYKRPDQIILYEGELIWIPENITEKEEEKIEYEEKVSEIVFGGFKYIFRGADSLAFKWIESERPGAILRSNNDNDDSKNIGVKFDAIVDYFYNTCYLNKLYPNKYKSKKKFKEDFINFEPNRVFCNEDKVLFGDELLIPIKHRDIEISRSSDTDLLIEDIINKYYMEEKGIKNCLSKYEMKEIISVLYHVMYDLRGHVDLKEKSYKKIIKLDYLTGSRMINKNNKDIGLLIPVQFYDIVHGKSYERKN